MRKVWLAACAALTATAGAKADEIDGLHSRAIDISVSFNSLRSPDVAEHGSAFASLGADGVPENIVVQARDTALGAITCTATVALPPGARQVSHPALSRSGWLFVTATSGAERGTTEGWRLYALKRSPQLREFRRGHCGGWNVPWTDLGDAGGTPLASAPDSVVAYDNLTYVFVKDRQGRIAYRMLGPVEGSPASAPAWRDWRFLRATDRNAGGALPAGSKPAVAIYNPSNLRGAGINYLHVFWFDPTLREIRHVRATIGWNGQFAEGPATSRQFGGTIPATGRTACTAGPEIKAPAPLFVVCGVRNLVGLSGYLIAHYSDPRRDWNHERAVEVVDRRPWVERSAYGGSSAPSLGPSGLPGIPQMFVTYGEGFCPPDDIRRCSRPGPYAIQNRWPKRREGDSAAHWLNAAPAGPLR